MASAPTACLFPSFPPPCVLPRQPPLLASAPCPQAPPPCLLASGPSPLPLGPTPQPQPLASSPFLLASAEASASLFPPEKHVKRTGTSTQQMRLWWHTYLHQHELQKAAHHQSACQSHSQALRTWLWCFARYFKEKHWLANNALGLAFSVQGIEHLSLGAVSTGVILLSGLFVYDIFWVFCTPVMVSVVRLSFAAAGQLSHLYAAW